MTDTKIIITIDIYVSIINIIAMLSNNHLPNLIAGSISMALA